MKIQLIRNATMKLEYGGYNILTDPMLSAKGKIRSFAGKEKNPTIELSIDSDEIMKNIDAVLVSHMHPDHFDEVASNKLDKELPIFIQYNEENKLKKMGFKKITAIKNSIFWNNIKITRIDGKHGRGDILKRMGEVSGYVIQAENEPTIYWIGDSVWCEEVKEAIDKYNPDIIITHSGGAVIPGFEKILMDAKETVKVAKYAEKSKIIAIHMESLDHCTVKREDMKNEFIKAKISLNRFFIPNDGEKITLKF